MKRRGVTIPKLAPTIPCEWTGRKSSVGGKKDAAPIEYRATGTQQGDCDPEIQVYTLRPGPLIGAKDILVCCGISQSPRAETGAQTETRVLGEPSLGEDEVCVFVRELVSANRAAAVVAQPGSDALPAKQMAAGQLLCRAAGKAVQADQASLGSKASSCVHLISAKSTLAMHVSMRKNAVHMGCHPVSHMLRNHYHKKNVELECKKQKSLPQVVTQGR